MSELYRVFVFCIACQLYCSAQGSALPLGKVRQGKLNSGETEEQRDYQAEQEDSQERQLQESNERRQLKKQQLYQSQERQSRQQESDEQNDSQQEPSQEVLEQREESQERAQLKREHSQEEEQEEQEEPEDQEKNKNQHSRQKLQQAKQPKEQIDEDKPANSEETPERENLRESEDEQQVEDVNNTDLGKTERTQDIENEVFAKLKDFKNDKDNSTQTKDQESIEPSPEDTTNKTETYGVIPDNYNQTEILEQQQISQDQLHNMQIVEEDTQQRVEDTQDNSTEPIILQELNRTSEEQPSDTQPLQKPDPEQEENDLHGQPSKQQHQYLPLAMQEFQSQPDTQIETQIPPPRATDQQYGENSTERDTKGHNESIVSDNYKQQNQNKSDGTRSEEGEIIQPAATDQQPFIEPNFMITPMIHSNITRPYALRRVNFSRNVTGMESADESRTLLKAALGLLTGLNMDTNNFGYPNMPSTGKFTASNTMSFLGKIFNTDFSISYGSPAASTHMPSIYPHTQVVYSPPLPMGHHLPVSVPVVFNSPLAIGHSNYYDRQEPQIQDEYISFPPYGKPHPDNVNWHRKPQFVPSNGPPPDQQHVGKIQEQHGLQIQEQTQLHNHQEQYQLQQHILRDQIQTHQHPEQHHLQHQLKNQFQQQEQNQLQQHLEQQQHQPEEQYRLEQLQELEQQHLLQLQQPYYEEHQPTEFFTSDSPIQDDNRYETTIDDGAHTDVTGQPEVTTTTETPFTSKSEEKSDSDVKQDSQSHSQTEDQDSSKTEQDDDRSLPHDSREVSIDSDQYVDEGSFSEEEVIRKKEKKRKRNKGRRRHHHRHHSRSDRRSQGVDSNESNVGSEDTRYRSSEDSRERDERTLERSSESRL